MLREIEVDVKTPQVTRLLAPDLLNLPLREDLAAGRLLDMRQRQEARPATGPVRRISSGVIAARLSQVTPWRQLDAHAVLHRLAAARHHHAGIGRSDRS